MRRIECFCGEALEAPTDAELFRVVQQHIDKNHADEGFTDRKIRDLIQKEAYNID